MSNAYGQRLKLRLFLEGIEAPVVAANIQTAPNSPMAASIQILPLAEGTRFLPRTLVHLFFLDMYEQKSPFITDSTEKANKRNPTAYERRTAERGVDDMFQDSDTVANAIANEADSRNSRYKVLFIGEVIGFQWTKGATNRSLVLQCADLSNYWDYAYQWNNTGIFGPGIKAVFSGGSTNLFTDFLSSKGEVITRIVSSGKCNTYPKLKGLAAGIIRLVEAIGGTYVIRGGGDGSIKKLAGQNIFFSLAELRLHITQMIGAYEDDPTSQRLLQRQGYTSLFNRALGNLGGQTSIRKAINALTAIIFHETYAQPCPYYVPGTAGEVSGNVKQKLKDNPDFKNVTTIAERSKETVQAIRSTLGLNTEDNPELKVLDLGAFKANTAGRLGLVIGGLQRVQLEPAVRKGPAVVRSILNQTIRTIASARVKLSKWRPQAPDAEKQPVFSALDEAIANLDRLATLSVSSTKSGMQEPARLMQQILRPDIWFGAPPRCNVLFPEDYDQLHYQRMFLQEPTRFMLKTNDEFFGEDELFDKFYFAPSAGSLKKDRANLQDMLKNDLLEHELFTGILPVFEKMGEFNVFASRSGTQQNPSKIGFAQRAANFLYFKHRFNARQMRVSGKFNPYIACGCPGLIIDKYVDQETIARYNDLRAKVGIPTLDRLQMIGTNFLGNFTQVSHSISQSDSSSRTEINIAYPRQVEESVEFLGAVEKVQTVQKRQDKDALRATDVAALSAPKIFSIGPLGGKITNVTDVTQLYTRNSADELGIETTEAGRLLPLFGRRQRNRGGEFKTPRVPVGVPTSAVYLGSPDVADIVGGDPNKDVVFSAFRIEEEVPRYRKEQIDLPAEEFIRPGWYGDIWTSSRIGRVYNALFGIGAITDPQEITDPSGASTGVQDEEIAQAQDEAAEATSADDPKRRAPAFLQLEANASIEQAVEFLVLTYSYIRQEGLDVDEFIRAYTWRPIATLIDMFGTSDLKLSPEGTEVLQGIEGFHSRAFGNYDDLYGLVGSDLEDILGIKRGSTVAQRGDTRKRKFEAVQQYVSALLFSRGILG